MQIRKANRRVKFCVQISNSCCKMARNFSEFYYCTVYLNVLLVVLCFFQYICDGAQSMMMKVYERPVGQKKVAAVSQVCVCEGLYTGIGGIVGQAQLTNF